jgi:prepilin-type processing-associated H-X9-DG protein
MNATTKLTKIDALVVILSILLILFVAGTVGKRGQDLNKRMICAANVKQITAGILNYADDHAGNAPSSGGAFWPWDVSKATLRTLLNNYMGVKIASSQIPVQDVFFCPSNLTNSIARNENWNYSAYSVLGYSFLWSTSWNSNGALPILGTGNKRWIKTIYIDSPSERELIVDALLSQKRDDDPIQFPNGNFSRITSGGNPDDSSNHLKTMAEPYGGNVGFVDGHVQWRPFSQMQIRWQFGSSNPYFWW